MAHRFVPEIRDNVVWIDGIKFDAHHFNIDSTTFSRKIGYNYTRVLGKQEKHKALCDYVEGSFAGLFRIWKALMIECYVVNDIPKELWKYFVRFKKNGGTTLTRVYTVYADNKDVFKQALKDGQKHLIPIIIAYGGKSPNEIRKEVGKGMWKYFCHNSEYRNNCILQLHKPKRRIFGNPIDIPHHRIKAASGVLLSIVPDLIYHYDESWYTLFNRKNNTEKRAIYHHLDGVRRMLYHKDHIASNQFLQKRPSRIKTVTDLVAYHHVLVEEMNKQRAASLPSGHILAAVAYKDIECFSEAHNFTAKVLTSYEEIAEEGCAMRHCVKTYSSSVAKGCYLIISVRCNDKRSSTLGLIKSDNTWRIDQHYGVCNRSVSTEEAFFGSTVLYAINKHKDELTCPQLSNTL